MQLFPLAPLTRSFSSPTVTLAVFVGVNFHPDPNARWMSPFGAAASTFPPTHAGWRVPQEHVRCGISGVTLPLLSVKLIFHIVDEMVAARLNGCVSDWKQLPVSKDPFAAEFFIPSNAAQQRESACLPPSQPDFLGRSFFRLTLC